MTGTRRAVVRHQWKGMQNTTKIFLYLVVLGLVLCSCAALRQDTADVAPSPAEMAATAQAGDVLADIGRRHRLPVTFKGTGTLTIREQDHLRLNRPAVWIGAPSDRLRVVIRGVGLPLVSMASDGQFLYLVLHDRGEFHRKAIDDAVLKELLAVPVPLADVIHLLAGQAPVRDYRLGRIEANGDGDTALVLMQGNRQVVEKIYLDPNRQVRAVEIFDAGGGLTYRAEFVSRHQIDGYGLPSELVITDANGITLCLKVEQAWADFPVSDSLFVLGPPA